MGASAREPTTPIGARRSGGKATVFDQSLNAFGIAIPSLDREERRTFAVGNSFFRDNWVTAPASTEGRDGLGPLFNAQSCSTCHFDDGRAKPPRSRRRPRASGCCSGSASRAPAPTAAWCPIPTTATRSRTGRSTACRPRPRCAITTEEIPGKYARRHAVHVARAELRDRGPANGPLAPTCSCRRASRRRCSASACSRRCPTTTITRPRRSRRRRRRRDLGQGEHACGTSLSQELALGRFGWKANVPTVEPAERGRVQRRHRHHELVVPASVVLGRLRPRASPRLIGGDRPRSTTRSSIASPSTRARSRCPARRDVKNAEVVRGEQLFRTRGMLVVPHARRWRPATSDIDALANQTIHPYTDLLRARHGPRSRRRPPRRSGVRLRVAHRAAVGHRARRRR